MSKNKLMLVNNKNKMIVNNLRNENNKNISAAFEQNRKMIYKNRINAMRSCPYFVNNVYPATSEE